MFADQSIQFHDVLWVAAFALAILGAICHTSAKAGAQMVARVLVAVAVGLIALGLAVAP